MNGYNGNSFLKKTGVEIEFTREQVEEYIKCSKDIIYFIKKYCKIITLDHGLQLFELYPFQEKMIKAFDDNRFIINLLPRQMGKSITVAAYLLHYAIFTPEKSIAILANKAAIAREILSRVQRMYENLPMWMQPGIKEWNKGSMLLGNDSWIMAAATSSSSIRGFSFNVILLDEFAHVEQQDEFWLSTYPVISSGESSKVIITSTPNGLDLFYKIFSDAKTGKNNFYPVEVQWFEHPKRDDNWKKITIENVGGEEQFAQEYGNEFLGSSGTLIAGHKLKALVYQDPVVRNDSLKMYEPVKADHMYVLTADVSHGKGLDYSAFHVIDVTSMPYKQVCVFHDNMTLPVEYAHIIYQTAKIYNEALIAVESNDIGVLVNSTLYDDLEYENVIMTENSGRGGKTLSSGFSSGNAEFGIRTTKTVKSIGCSTLKLLIEQDQLIINDFSTIRELSTFSKRGNSWEAENNNNDDLVMGIVIFSWLTVQEYFKELTDINTISQIRENNEEKLLNDMIPFGFIDDGNEEIEEIVYTTKNDDFIFRDDPYYK